MKTIVTSIALLAALTVHPGVAGESVPITLRPGDAAVGGAALEPFYARYREAAGRERTTRLERLQLRGEKALRLGITMLGTEASVYDEIQMLSGSLEPVMRIVSALTILHQIEVFDGASMKGFRVAKDGSAAEELAIQPDGVRFAGGTVGLVLADMDLSEGMQIDLPVFSTDMGPEMANLTTRVRVGARETLDAAGRQWDVWVVEVEQLTEAGEPLMLPNGQPMPRAKMWLGSEPPYTVRAQWAPGAVMELVEVR
jgi:hypothetical protein